MPVYLRVVLRLTAINQLHDIIQRNFQHISGNLRNALDGLNKETHGAEHDALQTLVLAFESRQNNWQSAASGFQLLIEKDIQLAIGADYFARVRSDLQVPKDLDMKFLSPAFVGPVGIKYFRNGQKLEVTELRHPA